MNQLAPPDPRPLPASRRHRHRLMLERAISQPARPAWPAWRRRGLVLTAGAALLATTAAGSAAYLAFAPASDQTRARCFPTADLGGNSAPAREVAIANSDPNSSAAVMITDPIELCALLWRSGIISADSTSPGTPTGSDHQVPPLVACVLVNGTAGVFPGDADTCKRLELPALRAAAPS